MKSSIVFILAAAGLFSGVLAGFLGIGGGTVLVPILVALGYAPVQSVATSSLAIVVTSLSGSIQNWRMGYLDFRRVLYLGLPALLTAQVGVYLADILPGKILLTAFGCFLLINVVLVEVRKRVVSRAKQKEQNESIDFAQESTDFASRPTKINQASINPTIARIFTGGTAGLMAGVFGVGGGVIMVPLQILLLGEPIKKAIQTSLGVIVLTAIASATGHALNGNVLILPGLLLGFGGLVGVQASTRLLPKLPDEVVSVLFRTMLFVLAIYIFWQAWGLI